MVQLNFDSQIYEIQKPLDVWCKRKLTPLGKIAVIKSMAVSKIVHLLLCLPDPRSDLLRDLNAILFKFLWDDTPDRIKKTTVQGEYQRGGLEIVDIFSCCKSLQVAWFRRMFKSESVWTYIVKYLFPEIDTKQKYGSAFTAELTEVITKSILERSFFNIVRSFRGQNQLKTL